MRKKEDLRKEWDLKKNIEMNHLCTDTGVQVAGEQSTFLQGKCILQDWHTRSTQAHFFLLNAFFTTNGLRTRNKREGKFKTGF